MDYDKTSRWNISALKSEFDGFNNSQNAKELLKYVYIALKEKGYNPLVQLTGFLTTGDPTYITSHKQARSMICRIDREDLVEELVNTYLNILNKEL